MKNKIKKIIVGLLSFVLLIAPCVFYINKTQTQLLNVKAENDISIRDKEIRLDILPFADELTDPNINVVTKDYQLDVFNTKCTVTLENVKYVAPDTSNEGSYELSYYFASANKSQIKINLDKQFYIKEATIKQLDNALTLTAGVKDYSINRSSSQKFHGNANLKYNSHFIFNDELRIYTMEKTNLPRVSCISLIIKVKPVDIKLSTSNFPMNKNLKIKLDVNHLPDLLENEVLNYKIEVFNVKNELLSKATNISKVNAKQFSFDIVLNKDLCVCNFIFTISSSLPNSLSNYQASLLKGININPIVLIRDWGDTALKMKDYDPKMNVGVAGSNECITKGYYNDAKATLMALEKENEGIIEYLKVNPEDNKFVMQRKARYEAWAIANNDYTPYLNTPMLNSGNFNTFDNYVSLSIVFALLFAFTLSATILIKKR